MATVTVAPGSVKHTLPDAYYGFNFAAFFHQDAISGSWQAAMNSIAPEIMRAHMWGYNHDYTGHANCRTGFKALTPDPKVMLQGDAFPSAVPSTLSPVSTSNRSAASNRSPASAANLFQTYIDAGLDVQWYEPYNEPTNCFDNDPGIHGNEWFSAASGYAVGQGEQNLRRHAEAWAIVHARHWVDAVRARAVSLSKTVKVIWHSWGSSGNSSFNANSMDQAMDGTPLPNGQTNPNGSPSNMPYFDNFNMHAYPGISGDLQARVNSYPYSAYVDNKGTIYGTWLRARAALDARGGSAKTIGFNEGPSLPDNRAEGAFEDILLSIISCIYQAKFKIDYAVFHSANRGVVGDEGHSIFNPSATPSTATMNTRGFVHRDLISPFMRLYKQQLIGGASASNPPSEITGSGDSPATANANSVKRIWCAAGKNAAGDKIAFLLCNLDKSNGESVTLQFGGTATANAVTKKFDASASGNNTAPTSGTLATNGNTSHTFTVDAGDAWLIEVPITGAGDVTAPVLQSAAVNPAVLTLTYNEALNEASVPQPGDYAVLKNGAPLPVASVDIAGPLVELFLSSVVTFGDTVTISYTRAGGREVEDPAGNLAANFSGQAVVNNTPPLIERGGLYFVTAEEITEILDHITEEPYATAWANEKAYADARLNYSPNPPDPNGNYQSTWHADLYTPGYNDGHAAHSLAFAYLMTGDAAYAERSLLILNAWRTEFSHPPGIGGGVAPGHMVAEPIGFAIKMFQAIDMLRFYMPAATLALFKTWANQWNARGFSNADSSRNSPWVANTVIAGKTYNGAWAGNSPMGQLCMGVWAAAVTGGATLTTALDRIENHTTSGGHAYDWDAILDGMIIVDTHTSHSGWPEGNLTPHSSSSNTIGETVEGHGRESGDYGLFGWHDLLHIADVAKHADYPVDFYTRETPAGRTLSDVAQFYGPRLQATDDSLFASFYGAGHDQDEDLPGRHRASWELLRKNLPTDHPNYQMVHDTVMFGGDATRAANHETHLARKTLTIIGASIAGGSPEPPDDFIPPTLVSAVTDETGTEITLTYDEALLNEPGTSVPAIGDFAVTTDSTPKVPNSVVASPSGTTVKLTFIVPFFQGEVIEVDYTQATDREIQDLAGNFAVNLTNQAVVNNGPPVPQPTVAMVSRFRVF